MSLPLITSAPGKVIIFGEHSAVFNEPAIAASVASLRTYLLVTEADDPYSIELDFPDIGLDQKWGAGDLKGIGLDIPVNVDEHSRELDNDLVRALEPLLEPLSGSLHYHAAYCFLYLYLSLCGARTGVKLTLKSSLPIGAGLGSSASIAVSLALALGKIGGHLSPSPEPLSKKDLDFVNKWSFIGEKCIHGTPSGIDNAVATYGNAVLFQRQENGDTNFKQISDFPQIPMILTNSRIPRSTKVLVSGVRDLLARQPSIVQPILSSMGLLASRGAELLTDLHDSAYAELCELVRINHGLLVALGVSHPGLEVIKMVADSMDIGATKLTGAGGGGCALTILKHDASPDNIAKFKDTLKETHNYEMYTTGLGGAGCAYIAPEQVKQNLDFLELFFQKSADPAELRASLLPGSGTLPWVT